MWTIRGFVSRLETPKKWMVSFGFPLCHMQEGYPQKETQPYMSQDHIFMYMYLDVAGSRHFKRPQKTKTLPWLVGYPWRSLLPNPFDLMLQRASPEYLCHGRYGRCVLWMNEIHFAPPKKPSNCDSPTNANNQCVP